jgi:hypothetical protein
MDIDALEVAKFEVPTWGNARELRLTSGCAQDDCEFGSKTLKTKPSSSLSKKSEERIPRGLKPRSE